MTKGRILLAVMALAMALAAVVLLSSCGGDTTDTTAAPATTDGAGGSATTEPAEASDAGELVIGVVNSLTGENQLTGVEQKWAQEQAVSDINDAGGVTVDGQPMMLKLVFADDKSTPDGAAAAMERLVNTDGAKLILGSNNTMYNLAAATVAEKYKVYFHINTSWTDFIDAEDFQWSSDVFSSTGGAAEAPFLIWNAMPEADRPQNPATIMEDNPDGQGFGAGFKAMAEKNGYALKVQEAYTPGTKDFSSTILKLKQNNVDAVLWLGSPPDSITLIRAMKEQNFAPKYIHGFKGMWTREFPDALGPDANYIIHDGFWADVLPFPGAPELGQKYRDAHDGVDSVSIGLPYAAMQVLAQAITNADSSDPAAVRDAIWGQTFTGTVSGDITYNDQGIAEKPLLALQWVDGERKVVYPADAAAGYTLQWMPAWDAR